MREGEAGNCAYILDEGTVEILVQREGQAVQIGTRGPGSLIGEMAMVDDQPRTATVIALEDCKVMEISREDFGRRLESIDPVLKMVMRVIMTRYRDTLGRSRLTAKPPPGFPSAETVEHSDASHDKAIQSIKVYNELRTALQNEELFLNFQPMIWLDSGKIAGFEALMRWNHPEKGLISPGIFIPVAEETGLIGEMSHWAFEEACSAVKLLKNSAKAGVMDERAPLFVSVNFSVKDFADEELFKHLDKMLVKKSTAPEHIHLEVTESLLMEQPENAKDTLEKCRNRGMSVAIDDFGTGYSSLSYLHYFPIDTLKVDRSFIRSMLTQDASMVLVKSVVALAKNLNMKVVAEGIETPEEAAAIRATGCDLAQGYYFSKPVLLAQALEMMGNWQAPEIPS